jgi:hypothetical protein
MASFRHSGHLASAGVAAVLALSAEPAEAQSNAELMDIIRRQQRQIEELSRKVDQLERKTEEARQKADTATETVQKVEETAPDIKVKWAPGPTFSSKDGSWSVHVLGRLMVDGGALGDDDDFYRNDNATELRAARLASRATSCRTGSTSSRQTSSTAPSTSRTPTSSTAASSSSPPTSASVSTRRRTRSSS